MNSNDQKEISMFVIGLIAGIIIGFSITTVRINQEWEQKCIKAKVAEYVEEDGVRFRFLTEH